MPQTPLEALENLKIALHPGCLEDGYDIGWSERTNTIYIALIEFQEYLETLPKDYKKKLFTLSDKQNECTFGNVYRQLVYGRSYERAAFALDRILSNDLNLTFLEAGHEYEIVDNSPTLKF